MEQFNKYSAILHIDTMTIGYNDCQHEVLTNCYFTDVKKKNTDEGHFEQVGQDELNQIIYENDTITFLDCQSYSTDKGATQSKYYKTYTYKGGFSANYLLKCIADFEKDIRPMERNKWFGNIDKHHIFFEGITVQEGHSYSIGWGS